MPALIDLRSDTVTLPPPEMRRAMHEAQLGDDVYGEDPTVNRLQERAAGLLGMEDALFVPSGTMGNLVAALTHCPRGAEILMGDQAHMFHYEGGGSSVLGGTTIRTLPNLPDGTIPIDAIRGALRDPENVHYPRSGLICLENTHNRCGGAVLTPTYMRSVRAVADEARIPVHLDGARLFNAAVALGIPACELTYEVDSVSVCFSKGLAAPVGSILCGPRSFIAEARRWRKMVGGGMRQAGVIAAAGLYALDHMIDRLAEDHANARLLAEGLCALPGLCLAQQEVQTNIVCIDVAGSGYGAEAFLERIKSAGVLATAFGPTVVRFVTHYGIERGAIEDALARLRGILVR